MAEKFLAKSILFAVTLALMGGCTTQQIQQFAIRDVSHQAASTPITVYHPDPDHLWNRLFAHFYIRTTPDGMLYGQDSLDPPLWYDTTYLLDGASHVEALALLDELAANLETSGIEDPLKRAVLQRDLWAVFDWSTLRDDTYPDARATLQSRLAAAIQMLALPRAEIEALSDNYAAAVASGAFASRYFSGDPGTPIYTGDTFLPPDLLNNHGGWVMLGRQGGPLAIAHVQGYPFLGRSAFGVLVQAPRFRSLEEPATKASTDDVREQTRAYLQNVQKAGTAGNLPPFSPAVDAALVRRMMLIDDCGDIVLSPLIESVQLRPTGSSLGNQFNLSHALLFAGEAGGLRQLGAEDVSFSSFLSHGIDWLEQEQIPESLPSITVNQCGACHRFGPHPISVTPVRFDFGMQEEERIFIMETTAEREAQLTIEWKHKHDSWLRLKSFFQD